MKEVAKEIEGKFTWIGKNTEKYITFSVQLQNKVARTDNIQIF